MVLAMLLIVTTASAQVKRISFEMSGGINLPEMKDVNRLYIQDLDGYKEVKFTWDLSTGFLYSFNETFSVKLGFNYLYHRQTPTAEIVDEQGNVAKGDIKYKIQGYCPYVGGRYNFSLGNGFKLGAGLDIIYCIAKMNDELPVAKTFFEIVHGKAVGFAPLVNIRKYVGKSTDLGFVFGYRFLNASKVKVESHHYPEFHEDVEFTVNGETMDLNFTGPFVRFMLSVGI